VRGDCSAGFATENIVEARERASLVIEPIVVQHRIADPPPGETIDNDVELIFGWTFGRRPIPGEDAVVEPLQLIDDRQLHLQPRRGDRANDFAEPCDDRGFILVNDKQQRSPLKRSQNEKNPEDRHHPALQKPHNRRHCSGSWSNIDHVHGELDSPGP
jgi:hypothetical protein